MVAGATPPNIPNYTSCSLLLLLFPIQVLELQYLLNSEGPEALAQYKPELLSWEEVQAISGPAPLGGLPLGHTPPKTLQQAQRRVLERVRSMEEQGLLEGHTGAADAAVPAVPAAEVVRGNGMGVGVGDMEMGMDWQGEEQEGCGGDLQQDLQREQQQQEEQGWMDVKIQREEQQMQEQKEHVVNGPQTERPADDSSFDYNKQPQQQQEMEQGEYPGLQGFQRVGLRQYEKSRVVLPSQDSLDSALIAQQFPSVLQKTLSGVTVPWARQRFSLDATMILQQQQEQQRGDQRQQQQQYWEQQQHQQQWGAQEQQPQQQEWRHEDEQQQQWGQQPSADLLHHQQQHSYFYHHQQQHQQNPDLWGQHGQQQQQLQQQQNQWRLLQPAEGLAGRAGKIGLRVGGARPRLPSQASLDVAMAAGNLLQHLGIFPPSTAPADDDDDHQSGGTRQQQQQGVACAAASGGGDIGGCINTVAAGPVESAPEIGLPLAAAEAGATAPNTVGVAEVAAAVAGAAKPDPARTASTAAGVAGAASPEPAPQTAHSAAAVVGAGDEMMDGLVVEGPSACTALSTVLTATGGGGGGWVTGRVTSRREFILQYSKLLQEEAGHLG